MGPFLPLFFIAAEHDYFSDGRWCDIRFVPTFDTQTLINKAGLLVRETANGIELYHDQSRTEALQLLLADTDGALSFGFKVYVQDGTFKNYSEAFLCDPDALPYFESQHGVAEGDRIRLHRAKQVSGKDMVPIESTSLVDLLDWRDLYLPPAFALRVLFRPAQNKSLEKSLQAEPPRYFLRFGSRKTYWMYYLLGAFANERANIVDLDGAIDFELLDGVSLSDKRPTRAFRTNAAIPLQQRSACRFQLREAGPGSGKVLVRRLPVAAATQVNRQTIGDKVVAVSEVYVNG